MLNSCMKSITVYYDEKLKNWDQVIADAKSRLPEDERKKVQVLCLPEHWRKRPAHEQARLI